MGNKAMARQYRSRLAKKESQRMIKQSILLFVLTGGFVVGIVLWGIPAVIRLAGFIGELKASNEPILTNDTLAPYPPQLAIPYEATSSSQIDIKGYAEAGAKVTLFNNENEVTFGEVNQSGEFVFEGIALNAGSNDFYVTAEDAANNVSDPSQRTSVIFDNQAPIIEISQPTEGDSFYTFAEQTIEVKGKISETAEIRVNNRITFPSASGEFTQKVRLEPGENTITVQAVDPAGNKSEQTLKVNFSD